MLVADKLHPNLLTLTGQYTQGVNNHTDTYMETVKTLNFKLRVTDVRDGKNKDNECNKPEEVSKGKSKSLEEFTLSNLLMPQSDIEETYGEGVLRITYSKRL